MTKFIIRNDDVAFDTGLDEIKKFCEICDRYGYKIIQAITVIGECRRSRATMTNDNIRLASFRRFSENKELVEFLKSRNDYIAVHGLWHTHEPTEEEIVTAKSILEELGFKPTHFVPPFNEGDYQSEIAGLTTCKLSLEKGERLEDFINQGIPTAPIMYLHSWRFTNNYFTFGQLDRCLARLASEASKTSETVEIKKLIDKPVTTCRLWYNEWIKQNARGNVLDVGKSMYWDYGFPTFDISPKRHPTYLGDIQKTDFGDGTFDVVLCNGMYEFVDDPQKMIDEVIRITKKGGKVIFGFVGKDYKPYKESWKFFEGKESMPPHSRIDFGQEYHFLICENIE